MTDPAAANPFESPGTNASAEYPASDSTIVFEGALNATDVRRAAGLERRGRRLRGLLRWVIKGVALCVLVYIVTADTPYSTDELDIYFFGRCVAIFALTGLPYLWYRLRLGRELRQREGVFSPTRTAFSENLVDFVGKTFRVEFQWSHFARQLHDEYVALLYPVDDDNYLLYSRRNLRTASDWERFCRMLDAKLPAKQSANGQ